MKLFALPITISFFSIAAYSQPSAYDSLPVSLSTLEAKRIDKNARLDWKVVCFLEYAKFEIQRSMNGINYTTINTFEADQFRCRQPFDFTDSNIPGKAFYKIRVGDLDGRFYNSKVVAVIGTARGFEINALTPSLVTNNTLLSISSAVKDNTEIIITNFQGTVVKRMTINLNKGVTEVPVNTDNLVRGNYILTVTNGFSDKKTTRFTKL